MRFTNFIVLFLLINNSYAKDNKIFLKENFNNLNLWKNLTFKKIKNHSKYTIEKNIKYSYLKAETNASASGIIFKKNYNIYKYPILKWRWKVSNVYKNGNAKEKSGDDYPIRIYILFKYNSAKASIGKRIKYRTVKALYGEYPPDSSLNYIWANKKYAEEIITNPYSDQTKMILIEKGTENVGGFVTEQVNIINDYKKAFKKNPPAEVSLAIMSDSDNTKEQATAFIDYIIIMSN